ncbi:MAG TPA: hydroxymethylglutaryl-CoA reductase, degradative [Spirochaetaceae bacterium]|nr:hydroxymethylglutaryl-CoA reductase, degradative [Spirochaetaceae bacterium]
MSAAERQGADSLPASFRKLAARERKALWEGLYFDSDDDRAAGNAGNEALELADILVESAVGALTLPLGIASGFLIDGRLLDLPLAVEEPSVIAAAGYAAHIIAGGGGFTTEADEAVMDAYVYLENVSADGERSLSSPPAASAIRARLSAIQGSLEKRGGGLKELSVHRLPDTGLVALELSIDVRDAMGANILNTAAEAVRPLAEELSGGASLMCILSNASPKRLARARFSLPLERLAPYCRSYEPGEAARRIELACRLANEDPRRAVTQNKGIMNGIASLAQATLNDTRAVEAAAHAWAARSGHIRSLSHYALREGSLEGSIELPLALGSVGGSVDLHPGAKAALRLLGNPDSRRLARIAAALGLAQNFAALLALVTGGIQQGHMKLHAARLAYKAGARGEDTRKAAELIALKGSYSVDAAREALASLKASRGGGETESRV